jgi:hypothetical protein
MVDQVNEHRFEAVFHFSHPPGPMMAEQAGACLIGEALDRQTELPVEGMQLMIQ